jgi:hypothetical protein
VPPWEFERDCPRRWWGVLLAEREERAGANKEAARQSEWEQKKRRQFGG